MQFVLIVIAVLIGFYALKRASDWSYVKRCFYEGNVVVCGLRGRGKDVLFSLIINSSKSKYISNIDYTGDSRYIKFKLEDINVGGNNFINFISGDIRPYTYPYPDGIDYFLSDGGIYFPSQEFVRLNKLVPCVPVFQAISRHLGDCNFHVNVQNLNRLWDKIREQADNYIYCRRCKVLFGKIVFLHAYVYDRYQSCVDRVKPMKRRMGKKSRIEYEKFTGTYGIIRKVKLIKLLRHNYDSRRFKKLLEEGGDHEKDDKVEVEGDE